jgi:pentatricopeptide repeat protein
VALRADILGDVFISYDLSTQNLLELLTIDTKDQLLSEIGLDPKTKLLKSRLFESFLIGEIIADQSVAEHHRQYWLNYQKSKQEARSSAQFTPEKSILNSGSSENPGVAKRLALGEETTKFMSLPGVEGSIPTPSFYKHIQGSTNSFFHMLDSKPASLKPEFLQMGDGKLQFQFNMTPTPTILHPFPTLTVFSKLTVPQFSLDDVTSYNTLMNAWVAVKDAAKCAETMQEMRGAGVVPDVTSYNTLMNAWVAVSAAKCAETMKEMRRAGVVPNVTSYNTLMNAYKNASQGESCLDLFHQMLLDHVRVDGFTISSLFCGLLNGFHGNRSARAARRAGKAQGRVLVRALVY